MRTIVATLLALLAVINSSSAAYSVAKLGAGLGKLGRLAKAAAAVRRSGATRKVDDPTVQSDLTVTPSPNPSHVTPKSSEPVLEVPSGSQHSEFMIWVVAPLCTMFALCVIGGINDGV